MGGWISIHRKIQDCWIWMDEPFSKGQAWVDLLLLVNHEDKKKMVDGKLMTIKTGQKLTSIRQLAERWQWSREKVARFLSILESDEMVVLKKSHHYTIVEVSNYADYQGILREEKATDKPQKSHQKATDKPQTDTNNKENNENKNNISQELRSKLEAEFEEIYKVYPKKKSGKGEAKEIFIKWCTTGYVVNHKKVILTPDDIKQGMNNYAEGKDWEDTKYWKDINRLMKKITDYIGDDGNDNG